MTYCDNLVKLREVLIFMQDVSTYSHVFVALGQSDSKEIIHLVYLKTG